MSRYTQHICRVLDPAVTCPQASDKSGKGIKYKAANGSYVDFKQVKTLASAVHHMLGLHRWNTDLVTCIAQALLQSRALESSLEGAMAVGIPADKEEVIGQLLAAFLPIDSKDGYALASMLVRLSTLLADDAPDTLGAAQRAVHSVVAALKAGQQTVQAGENTAVTSWLNRIEKIDRDIAGQQTLLSKLTGPVTKYVYSLAT